MAAQTATWVTITSVSTPATFVGGAVMIVYFNIKKKNIEEKIDQRARSNISETALIAENFVSAIKKRQWVLQTAALQSQHQASQRRMQRNLFDLNAQHQISDNSLRARLGLQIQQLPVCTRKIEECRQD